MIRYTRIEEIKGEFWWHITIFNKYAFKYTSSKQTGEITLRRLNDLL